VLQIRGSARGTDLTGTLYERGEEPPQFRGAPDDDAPYVWVCDAFYQVDSGGTTQELGDRAVQVAFETPMPRGFETRGAAIEAGTEHVRTQFARLGIPAADVTVDVVEVTDDARP
jgi:hypothetical protein